VSAADELCFLDATELARRIASKSLSASDVMQAHLERIAVANPALNAIVTLHAEQALAAARAADAAQARGERLGPLHGLPVAHKDAFLTRGMRTTFGSPLFANFVPDVDSAVVERQRSAGAIAVGKTNTPEFSAGSQTFNPVFGATRNPYDRARTCGGSSGGSAVALAAGMVALADGSDLGGSLRNPANFCNVVGLRPSIGCVPRWPVENGWNTLNVAGPMGRTVADTALLLSVIAGADRRDPLAVPLDGGRFRASLDGDVRGKRIAWSADLGGLPVEPAVRAAFAAQRAVFERLGCRVEDATPNLSGADEAFRTLRGVHFVGEFGELIERHPGALKDTIVGNVAFGRALSAEQIASAQRLQTQCFARMTAFLERFDVLVTPVNQVLPFAVEEPYPTSIDGVPMETYMDWMRSCYSITVTGHPSISVPAAFTPDGLPVGIQIVGRYRDEWPLLQLAYAFEAATQAGRRRPPPVEATNENLTETHIKS
jgi:amidase